jgi:hypothetical protein
MSGSEPQVIYDLRFTIYDLRLNGMKLDVSSIEHLLILT